MLIASESRYVIDKLKKYLSSEFEMKDLGETKKVLGMEIKRDWKGGKISDHTHILAFLSLHSYTYFVIKHVFNLS